MFRTKLVALATVAAMFGVPSIASAKNAKKSPSPITKAQVIALIKQYSKPGKTGKTGAPGPSWKLAPNSGLSLTGTNTLSLLPGLTTPCGYHQDIYYLDPFGSGTAYCSYPVQGQFASYGFVSTNPYADPQVPVSSTVWTSITGLDINYASGSNPYMVNAVVELVSNATSLVRCRLDDMTTGVVIEAENYSLNGYGNLSFLARPNLANGDALAVQCTAVTFAPNTTVDAQATYSAIPLG